MSWGDQYFLCRNPGRNFFAQRHRTIIVQPAGHRPGVPFFMHQSDIHKMSTQDCRFCNPRPGRELIKGTHCFAGWDRHPVNPGHMLVIPYRHFESYFEATSEERLELWELVDQAKTVIDEKHSPDGYNIGINIGEHAGQSIMHLHIHIIPRYKGDVENPKGGVRGVIPARQKYQMIA